MSFYEDYVADGSHCQCCGVYLGKAPGYPRSCRHCEPAVVRTPTQKRNARKRRAKQRARAAQLIQPSKE